MEAIRRRLADQQGIVLVISLLILALLMAGGVGAIVSMQTDLKTSGNLKAGTQAFYIADAGVNHARQQLQGAAVPNFASIFTAADGTVVVSNGSFYGGAYTVTRQGSTTTPYQMIKVLAVGTAPNNARAEIEVWFKKGEGKPPKAIETRRDLGVQGNSRILGVCGGAHANDDIEVQGNPAVEMADGFTASGAIDLDGSPCVGSAECGGNPRPQAYVLDTYVKKETYEASNRNKPPYSFPTIDPSAYASLVAAMAGAGNHYIMHDDGAVAVGGTCDASGLCSRGSLVSVPAGWSFSNGKWRVSGNGAASGVFYSETAVEISGNPGSEASPWEVTIISRDDVTISGNPRVKPYPTTADVLKNHLIVAGNDLRISGNLKATYARGAILVNGKVQVSGNPAITGFIIASEDVRLSGNMEVTYNCDFGCSGPGCPPPPIITASWAQKF